jgi:predicted nucleic acid-binding protein
MNVIDSSAWLSFFSGDRNSAIFEKPILDTQKLLVPTITITEVFKNILRQSDEESALSAIAHMQHGTIIPLTAEIAVDAASYGVMHKLPLADSIIFATAKKYNATIWTQDADFYGLPQVRYFAKAK